MEAAPAMQSLLSQIQELSSKNLGHLQNSLKAAESGLQQTAQQQGGGFILQALQQLNPLAHTFGCIALLCASLPPLCPMHVPNLDNLPDASAVSGSNIQSTRSTRLTGMHGAASAQVVMETMTLFVRRHPCAWRATHGSCSILRQLVRTAARVCYRCASS